MLLKIDNNVDIYFDNYLKEKDQKLIKKYRDDYKTQNYSI